jgi:hypothetical protein
MTSPFLFRCTTPVTARRGQLDLLFVTQPISDFKQIRDDPSAASTRCKAGESNAKGSSATIIAPSWRHAGHHARLEVRPRRITTLSCRIVILICFTVVPFRHGVAATNVRSLPAPPAKSPYQRYEKF